MPIRSRLTYANLMSTIAVFLVLGGATAFAAGHLGKNSVGTPQLKANAVTGPKIKDGAVTAGKVGPGAIGSGQLAGGAVGTDKLTAGAVSGQKLATGSVSADKIAAGAVDADKLAAGSVNSGKLADGSVTAAKIDLSSVPFSRIVQRIQGTAKVPFAAATAYPLANPTYTQPPGEDDQYLGEFEVTFAAGCGGRRSASAFLREAQAEPPGTANSLIGRGSVETETTGEVTRTVQFVPSENGRGAANLAPATPTQRTFVVEMNASHCGTGAGVTMDGARVDVIGTR